MTIHRSLAAHNLGRIASALLTAVLVMQPNSVIAQTIAGIKLGQELTTVEADPLSTVADEALVSQTTVPPTAQIVLLSVCQARGYGEDCAKALLGMMWKESNNRNAVVGDHGLALGYFQIHYKMHKVSRDCATDLACSAEWTLSYMEKNGYPKYPKYAVQCHNGCGINNGYAASALRHGERLWSQPMSIQVAVAN